MVVVVRWVVVVVVVVVVEEEQEEEEGEGRRGGRKLTKTTTIEPPYEFLSTSISFTSCVCSLLRLCGVGGSGVWICFILPRTFSWKLVVFSAQGRSALTLLHEKSLTLMESLHVYPRCRGIINTCTHLAGRASGFFPLLFWFVFGFCPLLLLL